MEDLNLRRQGLLKNQLRVTGFKIFQLVSRRTNNNLGKQFHDGTTQAETWEINGDTITCEAQDFEADIKKSFNNVCYRATTMLGIFGKRDKNQVFVSFNKK